MGLALVTAPTVRAVLLEEVKDHLRIDREDDVAYVDLMIAALMDYVDGDEGVLHRALITQTWDLTLDDFPTGDHIKVPLPPLQSVSSITYTDANGDSQTWASSNYTVITDRLPGEIHLAYGKTFPAVRDIPNAVTVRFIAGYGDSWNDVPDSLRLALMQLAAHWYENRTPVVVGQVASEIPLHLKSLLMLHRFPVVV